MKIKFLLCMALAISLFSCGNDGEPWNDDTNGQSNNSSVVINADGSTSTGAPFSMLDGTTFYLDYIKYQIVDSHLEIVGYDKTEIANDVRPYAHVTLNGTKYSTRVIAANSFKYCNMQSLTIPSTVQKVTLYNCSNLSQVFIPNSVTELTVNADELTEISIPNSVTLLDLSCPKLIELTIPKSVKFLAVGGCSSLTEISIPNSVTDISWLCPNSAFRGCTGLTEIKIPNSIKSISQRDFTGCTNLKRIILPENLYSFDKLCISGCESLSDIYLGECNYVSNNWPSHNKTITIHVKSECVKEMTNKLVDSYGYDKIVVVGDYSSSILN